MAAWVSIGAVGDLVAGNEPEHSVVGIVLTATSLIVMPWLAMAKRRNGETLASKALVSESRQTAVCAYLSAAVLVGLALNAFAGLWWADPVAALAVAAIAARRRNRGLDRRTPRRRRVLLMNALALALYVAFAAAAFGWRTWMQWQRTGDTGLRMSATPGSRQWWAKLGFIGALVAGVAAPIAGLAGLDTMTCSTGPAFATPVLSSR